jgi:hypothetical protein
VPTAISWTLDYASGQVHWQLGRRKDGQAFITFLEQLRHARPDEKLDVVLENVSSHKSRVTLAWGQRWQHHLCPVFLPASTPELNLME